ncbi:hypothetical protein [Catellatospora tritici]|uniref:cysteine dioxygenase family protein n=1 Tax=Catellatospora tritici TaxID=2851566 RepID=UPI001C2CE8D5|nr:hypothetical protein [Catellatospora tritici]
MTTALEKIDQIVASHPDCHTRAAAVAQVIPDLLASPDSLDPRFRESCESGYRQHLVHVHPQGLYSVVSLVWLPGQETPIHNHKAWCVVGVLQGVEEQTTYALHDQDGDEWLSVDHREVHAKGSVSVLVPPAGDIHKVANHGPELAVSIHVYGTDITDEGTSIHRTFSTDAVRESSPPVC